MKSQTIDDIVDSVAETAGRFLRQTCEPRTIRELANSERGFDQAWWQSVVELGWLELVASDFERSTSVLAQIGGHMGRTVAPGPIVPAILAAEALRLHAQASGLRHPLLEGLLGGTTMVVWCADPIIAGLGRGVAPVLKAAGDGELVLDGNVVMTEAACAADWLVVPTLCGEDLEHVVVSSSAPGVTVTPHDALDLVRRFGAVSFDEVTVTPPERLPFDGERIAARVGNVLTVLNCAESLGAGWRAHEFTIEYLSDRVSFGRPLASYQVLKHRVADQLAALHSCASAVESAVQAIDDGSDNADEMCSIAASFVHDSITELLQDCVQLHGGIGVTWEHDLHLFLRRAATNRSRWGTPAEHREHIAQLIGLDSEIGVTK